MNRGCQDLYEEWLNWEPMTIPDPPQRRMSKEEVIEGMCQFGDGQMSPKELANAALKVYVIVTHVFCGPGTNQDVLRALTNLKLAAMSKNESKMSTIVKELIDLVCDMEPYVERQDPARMVRSAPVAPPKRSTARAPSVPVRKPEYSTAKTKSEPVAPPKHSAAMTTTEPVEKREYSTVKTTSEPVEKPKNSTVVRVNDALLRRQRPKKQQSYRNKFADLGREESENDSADEQAPVHSLPSRDFERVRELAQGLKAFLDHRTNGITQRADAEKLRNLISQLWQVSPEPQWKVHLLYLDHRSLVPLQYLGQIRNDLRLCE